MFIKVAVVSKEYSYRQKQTTVLHQVDLAIERGEFICLLGPSGCGKSTLLNLIAGFDQPSAGQITIKGQAVVAPSINYVTIFQNYGLLPWRTVQKNVELGLKTKKFSKAERKRRAEEYLELVGLTEYAKHHPAQLSGGMQQRVAIARALAVEPEIIFMDEPFGALDALTRMNLQDQVARLWEVKRQTIIFVTHDIDEAVFLADRIVIMTPGPGQIKSIIPVSLPQRRDRTDPDYLKIRDRVFAEFSLKTPENLEYYL